MFHQKQQPGSLLKKIFKADFFFNTVIEIAYVGSRFRSAGRLYTNIDRGWPDSTRIYMPTGHDILGRPLFDQKYVFSEPTDPKARWQWLPRPFERPRTVLVASDRRP